MTRLVERFHFIEHLLNTTKLGSIRLSVYNSVFNIIETNNQFGYRVENEFFCNVDSTAEVSLDNVKS